MHWMRASQTSTGLNTLADSGKFGFINWGGWLWWPDLDDSWNRETGNGDWRPYLDNSWTWNEWWAAMTTWSWPGVMQTGPVLKMQMKVTVKTFQWVLCLTNAKELCAGDTEGGWMYCQHWLYVCGRQAVMCNQVVGKGVMDELHSAYWLWVTQWHVFFWWWIRVLRQNRYWLSICGWLDEMSLVLLR